MKHQHVNMFDFKQQKRQKISIIEMNAADEQNIWAGVDLSTRNSQIASKFADWQVEILTSLANFQSWLIAGCWNIQEN